MSSTSDNPPIGTGGTFRHDDPDDPDAAREARRAPDDQTVQDRELDGSARTLAEKADQIVTREQGVTDFSEAEETDAMIQPRSVNDRDDRARGDGSINIADAIGDTVREVVDPDDNDRRERRR